eukprot:6207444-Pleurochrysis_carterae.AAC.2
MDLDLESQDTRATISLTTETIFRRFLGERSINVSQKRRRLRGFGGRLEACAASVGTAQPCRFHVSSMLCARTMQWLASMGTGPSLHEHSEQGVPVFHQCESYRCQSKT